MDNPVNADEFASLFCTVSKGDLPLRIMWQHNSYNITPVDGITTTRTSRRISQLSIESVQAHHAGRYTCTAKNRAGETSHTAILNVNGEF